MGQLSGVLELPADLELAKKSLMSTLSALYAIIVVCVCVTCTATEIITEKGKSEYTYGSAIIRLFFGANVLKSTQVKCRKIGRFFPSK